MIVAVIFILLLDGIHKKKLFYHAIPYLKNL